VSPGGQETNLDPATDGLQKPPPLPHPSKPLFHCYITRKATG